MDELCTGCLAPGRVLKVLNEEKNQIYLSQLPVDIRQELATIKFSFCFHCSTAIYKIYQFQQLSSWAIQKLISYHNTLTPTDNSDKPYFQQLNICKSILINIPSDSAVDDVKIECPSETDIFNENKTDNITNDNIKNENINDIDEEYIGNVDYHCEPDSFVNDILIAKLVSYTNNDKEESKNIELSNNEKSLEAEEKSKEVSNKPLKKKRNTISKNKIKKRKKTRNKSISSDSSNYEINDSDTNNDNVLIENDNLRTENDSVRTENDNIGIGKDTMINNDIESDKKSRKAEIISVTLGKSEIREERKQMMYNTEYRLSHFKCNGCIIGYDNIDDYDKHFAEYHDKSVGVFVCVTCSCRFSSANLLDEHSREHSLRYKCSICRELNANKAQMEAHLLEHDDFKCHLCGVVCGTTLHHQIHLNKKHGLKLKCNLCEKTFSSGKTLRYHLKVLHKGQNRYPCPHCGKIYQWKSNLFRHIKNHKAQISGELYCAVCDKFFSSVATYRVHLASNKRHVSEENYSFSCDQCEKKFVLKRDLTDHVNWEHLHKTVHVCQQCAKPFKSHMALYLHQNVHKDPADRRNLCHLCGKCYPTQSKLKSHLQAKHSDVMPYKCKLCDAVFNWYSSLYRHAQKIHGLNKEQYKVKKQKLPEEVLPSVV